MAGCIAAFFFYCTWPGLFIGFDDDDVMNLHVAWSPPLRALVLSNLVPFTPLYRPAGAAYYRICFALFGWNPAAFRAVTFVFVLVNIWLVYWLARRLTASLEASALAALIFSFHPKLREIYMSNGAVYDVLCGTFSLLALLYYMRLRERDKSWKWWEFSLMTALFIAAVNAKEMAAILPAIFFIYDWLFYPPSSRKFNGLARWLSKNGRAAGFLAILAALAFWGKRRPGGAFFQQALYETSFTSRRFFGHERRLISDLFLLPGRGATTALVVACYAALFLIAALTRKKYLWFCAWFALLAPLPVVFIPYRGFFVMYLPMAGWAIFAASVIVKGRDWLWRVLWKRPPLPYGAWQPERVFTFAAVAFLIALGRNTDLSTNMVPHSSAASVAETYSDIMRLKERLPPRAYILLLRCPYPDESWGPMQMMQLLYHDRNLIVDRPTMMKVKPDEKSYAYYDRVIDFNGKDLLVLKRRTGAAEKGRLPG